MRYFTNNPLERLMMQKPKAAREDSPPAAAKEHFCYGCKRFGQLIQFIEGVGMNIFECPDTFRQLQR